MKFNVDKLQEPLLKASMWVQNNTILQAVKNAFVRTIPFTVIGSFSNLIKMQLDALIKSQNLHWGWSCCVTVVGQIYGAGVAVGLMCVRSLGLKLLWVISIGQQLLYI